VLLRGGISDRGVRPGHWPRRGSRIC
jgi:hypothetical protein